MKIESEKISKIMNECDENIEYVNSISNDIVKSKTQDLDELMTAIQNDIIIVEEPDVKLIERYFLELTNALYFINTRCESFGFYDDIAKSNSKLKLNQEYVNSQISSLNNKTKVTINDLNIAAENKTINENIVSLIYSRSFRIIKVKIDAANEMVRTLSKVLSARMSERQLSNMSNNVNTFPTLQDKKDERGDF